MIGVWLPAEWATSRRPASDGYVDCEFESRSGLPIANTRVEKTMVGESTKLASETSTREREDRTPPSRDRVNEGKHRTQGKGGEKEKIFFEVYILC